MRTEVLESFESDASEALGRVRNAFTGLLSVLPEPVEVSADLRRLLALDNKLCWRILKVTSASGVYEAGLHIPSPAGMKSLCQAAHRIGIADERIEAIRQAGDEFEELVARHAGDRHSFDAMISFTADGAILNGLAHRRAAYRANSHIWGVQARTQLKCVIVRPSNEDESMLDGATINGFVHLRQLRAAAPLVISRVRNVDDDGGIRTGFVREPLDSDAVSELGIALIHKYCSKPLPKFREVEADAGFIHGELVPNGVGNLCAITCIEGNIAWKVNPRYRDSKNFANQVCAGVHVPCETLIVDFLVRDDTYDAPNLVPELVVYGEQSGEAPYPTRSKERDLLPIGEAANYIGKGTSCLYTPHFSRYTDLVSDIFKNLSWDASRFLVFRCVIKYPIMPSSVVMRFDLPDPPDAHDNSSP